MWSTCVAIQTITYLQSLFKLEIKYQKNSTTYMYIQYSNRTLTKNVSYLSCILHLKFSVQLLPAPYALCKALLVQWKAKKHQPFNNWHPGQSIILINILSTCASKHYAISQLTSIDDPNNIYEWGSWQGFQLGLYLTLDIPAQIGLLTFVNNIILRRTCMSKVGNMVIV